MATKHGLARGLDALLPETDLPAGVTEIAVSQLDPNPDQPRRTFDTQALEALAESIRQAGVLQPLLVVENGARYRIVAGERRYRAARMAGLQSVPCVVRDMTEQERMEAALIENLQREDLNPIEEAAGIRALRTMAQTAAATIGATAVLCEVNWLAVVSSTVLAGILSLLTSLAGLPELEE